MSRMFEDVVGWTPGYGCPDHKCPYCWARRQVARRRAVLTNVYLDERKLEQGPPAADNVFVWHLGDLWSKNFPAKVCDRVIERVWTASCERRNSSQPTNMMFLTKNPEGYLKWFDGSASHIDWSFGVTIESNRQYREHMGMTPHPAERFDRFHEFLDKHHGRGFLSIEPVMDFDFARFSGDILNIKDRLEMVYIGYDNYKCKLPEPRLVDAVALGERLKKNGVRVSYKTLRERWNGP